MNLTRVKAILLEELFITKHSLEIIMDLPLFSVMGVLVFGFITTFLSGSINTAAAFYLLLGALLWEIIRIGQYSVTVGSLWELWSKNLTNLFISPISLTEYIGAHILSSFIKVIVLFTMLCVIANLVFHFNVLSMGLTNLVFVIITLLIFAWSLGIFLLGLIFRFGPKIQALAWGLVFFFQPLIGVYFPVDVLPPFLRTISYSIPPTYALQAARAGLTNPTVDWNLWTTAFLLTAIYFLGAILIFWYLFEKSRSTGRFARNES